MSILTVAWSGCAAAGLMLALMQVFLWFHERPSPVYLLTALACLSAAATAMLELSLMYASSTAAYAEILRWENLTVFLLLVSLVWAVYLYLGTGRLWLASVITVLWVIALVVNFVSPSSIVFAEIQGLKQMQTYWGGTFVGAVGVRNAWLVVTEIASLLILVFFADSAVRSWRRGQRRRAVVVGIGAGSNRVYLREQEIAGQSARSRYGYHFVRSRFEKCVTRSPGCHPYRRGARPVDHEAGDRLR